uniref:Uncharacterized protein MANES_15G022100 n=1 Tax=Rhizophora mucronata TaxID=61149 RepID=A0A2P2KL04_RHIMU
MKNCIYRFHDLFIVWAVHLTFELKSISLKQFHIKLICHRLGTAIRNNPVREESKNHERRDNLENQGLLQEFPESGDIVFPTNIRYQHLCQLWRWQRNP